MPKVLRILNRLIIGGPAINVTYLTKYMEPEFDTVLVIGGKEDAEQEADHLVKDLGLKPVIVEEMKRQIIPLQDGLAYRKIKELIDYYKPDIVHTHAAKSGIIGRLAADACKVPVILHTFHGHVFHSYFNKVATKTFIHIERYLAKKSTGIIAISESQKQELAEVYKICPEEKIQIIPLGLDLDKFYMGNDDKRKAFRNQYFIADDEIAIGIIGRVVHVKNHALFVEAAKKLTALTDKKLKFIIIGDGDLRADTQTKFSEAGIDNVYFPDDKRSATAVFTSWQTDVDRVLAGLDIVALTSHNEGTPVSLIEAQAAGKPIVSTNVGGVLDVMQNQASGFVVPPGDADALAQALQLLAEDENKRVAMGEKGRNYVQQKYSYQRLVKNMSSYYNRLLEEKAIFT